VAENGGQAIVTVTRTGGVSETVSVNFQTSPGTAVAGTDYLTTNGTLVLGPGVASANFAIQILDNGVQNPGPPFNRTVILDLAAFTNGAMGSPLSAVLTIVDDERFNEPAGSVDTTYNAMAGANGFISTLLLQADGRLLIGGDFTAFNGLPKVRLARLDANGVLDATFNTGTGFSDPVQKIAAQPDGRLVIGGSFTNVDGANRNRVARLNVDGTLDLTFDPGAGADNPVSAVALHSDPAHAGKIVLGGAFATFNGQSRPFVARINPDGTLDGGFNTGTGPDAKVNALALQMDGKVVIGGDFTNVNGTVRQRLARLNADGSLDTAFGTNGLFGADGSVRAITLQSDGRILVGGVFTNFNGLPVNRIVRLLADGTLDPAFTPNFNPALGGNGEILTIVVQADGKILVGGDFTSFSGVTRNRFTRLKEDGTVDPTINFGLGANSFVAAAVVQLTDGKIIVGGGFTQFDGQPRNFLARLHGGVLAGPGRIEFTAPFYSVVESNLVASIGVRRTGGTTGGVFVNFATSDGTAVGGAMPGPGIDYLSTNLQVNFPEGETIRTVFVDVVNDALPEPDKTVNLALSTNAMSGAPLGNQPTATLTIVNDDSFVSFSAAAYSVNENDPTTNATITIVRTAGTNGSFSVDVVTTTNLTATEGVDYTAVSNTVTFLPGETFKTVFVPVLDDVLDEGDETVGLILTNVAGSATIAAPSDAVLTIVENEFFPGLFSFSQPIYVAEENATNALITVIRTNGSSGVVTVDFATSDGTATTVPPVPDYVPTNGTLVFAPGETMRTFAVRVLTDLIQEPVETVNLTLSNPTGGSQLGDRTNAVLSIVDSEPDDGSFRFVSTNSIPIQDAAPAGLYPSEIIVSNLTGAISNLTVTLLGLSHTAPADLDVLLVGPVGQKVLLMSDAGGGLDISNVVLRFADNAASFLPQFGQIAPSTNRPTDYPPADTFFAPAPAGPYGTNLADFIGTDPNGTWQLYVVDDAGGDFGLIENGWRISIFTVDLPRLTIVPSGGSVVVSWPTNFAGFVLECRDDFMSGSPWLTVTNLPVVMGGQNTVTLPLVAGDEKFFRLRKP
jgi:uncharacterized delta-60 repeat protein